MANETVNPNDQQSSVDFMKSLGKPVELVGSQMQIPRSVEIGKGIKMEAGRGKGDEVPEWIQNMGLEYGNEGQNMFEVNVVDKFIKSVKNISRSNSELERIRDGKEVKDRDGQAKTQEKVELELKLERERINHLREELLFDQLSLVDSLHEEMLGFESPYPYDSRFGANFIRNFGEKIDKELVLKKNEKKLDEESRFLLREMKEVNLWAEGTYHVLEGLGSAMKAYYDGELQANMLFSQYKRIVAKDFKRVFAEKLDGISLSVEEKTKMKNWGYLKENEAKQVETMRDEIIRYTDDQMFWTTALASAGQWDHSSTNQHDRVMKLTDRELLFIQKCFGVVGDKNPLECTDAEFMIVDDKKIPKSIFSWFGMENTSDDNLELVQIMMQVVLEKNIKYKLDHGGNLDALTKIVKDEAKKRFDKIEAPKETTNKLSFAIFNQSIIMMNGFMASGDLGWRFDYFIGKDAAEKDVLKRKMEGGSIYTAFDVGTIYYFILHKIQYDAKAEDRSTIWPASVGPFRKEFDDKRPDFKFDIYKYAREVGDTKMIALLNMLENNPFENNEIRPNGKFGKLNIKFLNMLKKNISGWLVPFYEKNTPDMTDPTGKKQKEVWLPFPVSLPPVIDSISFFRAIGWSKDGTKSLFDQMTIDRTKPSQIKWNKLTRHAFDGWRVTTSQMHKWFQFFIGAHDLDRDKETAFKTLFEDPRGVAFKNLDKRGRLGSRMMEQEKGLWNLSFMPMLITLATAKQDHLMGRNLTSPSKKDTNSPTMEFRRSIASWINIALDMPGDAYGLENYNGSMAFMIFWYGSILERISDANKANYGVNYSNLKGSLVDRGGLMDKIEELK